MTFNQLRIQIESHCRTLIAPEIDAVGCGGPYIVTTSEAELQEAWFDGLCHPAMGVWYRDVIGSRFTTDGPCFVLPNDLVNRHTSVQEATTLVATIAVHELCHCLQYPGLYAPAEAITGKDIRTASEFRDSMARVETRQIQHAAATGTVQLSVVDDQHDSRFIRTAIHAAHRMQNLMGQRLPMCCLHSWRTAGLPPAEHFRHALADELHRLRRLPLSLIQQIDPPDEFSKTVVAQC